jgi:hypothetical protein
VILENAGTLGRFKHSMAAEFELVDTDVESEKFNTLNNLRQKEPLLEFFNTELNFLILTLIIIFVNWHI